MNPPEQRLAIVRRHRLPDEVAPHLWGTTPEQWNADAAARKAIELGREADAAIRAAAGYSTNTQDRSVESSKTLDQEIRTRAGRPPAPNTARRTN